jgi:hypothetical protein
MNNILVPIVTGLPEHYESPLMLCKEDPLFIHFNESEVISDVKEVFLNYISDRHPTVVIDEGLLKIS